MALYDLKCLGCGQTSEWLVRQQDLDTTGNLTDFKCPHCSQSVGYSKLFSASTTFHLKGDGWFKDGYGSKPNSGNSESS